MKRYGTGGTEVSVEINCEEERKLFEIGALSGHYRRNLDLRDLEKRKEWSEEWRVERDGAFHDLITRQCPCYGQVYSTAARQGSQNRS